MESESLRRKGYIPLPIPEGSKFPTKWKGYKNQPIPDLTPFESPNLGIRGDGLLPIDIDVDDPEIAQELIDMVPLDGPIRSRANSGRRTILLRCPELDAAMVLIRTGAWKHNGKTYACVEMRGGGSFQTMTHGEHPSGAQLIWTPGGPDPESMMEKGDLPVIKLEHLTELRDRFERHLRNRFGPPPVKKISKKDWSAAYVLTNDMVFVGVDGTPWTVRELKMLGPGQEVRCHLTGVRPDSDSEAGIARVGLWGLFIVDFVTSTVYRPAHPKGVSRVVRQAYKLRHGGWNGF